MNSKKYNEIVKSVEDSIQHGKLDSFLNRMQFDYEIRNVNEFSNYLVILLTLMEKGGYEIANNILLRKVINSDKNNYLVGSVKDKFDLIKLNSVFPFVGISNTIASFISDFIDKSDNVRGFEYKVPDRKYLLNMNYQYLKMYFENLNKEILYREYIRLLYNCIEDIAVGSREVKLYWEATLFLREVFQEKEQVLQNYLSNFLREGGMRYSVPGVGSVQVVPEPFFLQIFESIETFEYLVSKSNSKVKDDIILFLAKYQEGKKVYLSNLNLKRDQHFLLKTES